LLADFIQVYGEKLGAKTEQKGLEILQFSQKILCKVGANEGMISEEIDAIKKKPGTFSGNNGRDVLRAFQELARSHP
jgi:hypothetical protein